MAILFNREGYDGTYNDIQKRCSHCEKIIPNSQKYCRCCGDRLNYDEMNQRFKTKIKI